MSCNSRRSTTQFIAPLYKQYRFTFHKMWSRHIHYFLKVCDDSNMLPLIHLQNKITYACIYNTCDEWRRGMPNHPGYLISVAFVCTDVSRYQTYNHIDVAHVTPHLFALYWLVPYLLIYGHWRAHDINMYIPLTLRNARCMTPDSKVHGANRGPSWVLLAPDVPHVGSMNLAIRGLPDNKDPRIDIDEISIRSESVWWMYHRSRSDGICWLVSSSVPQYDSRMAQCTTVVTPVRQQCGYHRLPLRRRYNIHIFMVFLVGTVL